MNEGSQDAVRGQSLVVIGGCAGIGLEAAPAGPVGRCERVSHAIDGAQQFNY